MPNEISRTSFLPECECRDWATNKMVALLLGNGHNPACDKYRRGEMRVYRMNDCDWYMARSVDDAIRLIMEDTELPKDEATDGPHEVCDENMGRLMFVDDDGERRTFAMELHRRVVGGENPGMFASTEV